MRIYKFYLIINSLDLILCGVFTYDASWHLCEKKFKMASNRNDVLVVLALQNQLIAAALLKEKQSKRRFLPRNLWKARERLGHYSNLLTDMRYQDHTMHFSYFRMLPLIFDDLLHLVRPSLTM